MQLQAQADLRDVTVTGRGYSPALGRAAAVGLPFALVATFITYMAVRVPVRNLALDPVVTGGGPEQWKIAGVGVASVLAVTALTLIVTFGRRRSPAAEETRVTSPEPARPSRFQAALPAPLRIRGVPPWALNATLALSGVGLALSSAMGLPMWQKTLWTLVPWVPVLVVEEVWKYRRYGFYAVFLGLAVVQVGHLGEHAAQVFQLAMYEGDLARSHGIFGQLDFEGVHFSWDTAVWIGGAVLVYRWRHNAWLWLSWILAGLHEVEHIYLFWINQAHPAFWAHGGISGIFGEGGLIGSPLSRPYLHFVYNFLVVVAMLFGLWQETRRLAEAESGTRNSLPV